MKVTNNISQNNLKTALLTIRLTKGLQAQSSVEGFYFDGPGADHKFQNTRQLSALMDWPMPGYFSLSNP